jgi:GrpB-like predicted nucleotidyltransferase (UPF0157 family)
MKKILKVIPYDSNWPDVFASEASVISGVLRENCVDIQHIGSTAVPGLAAKPIIDIIVIVDNLLAAMDPLISLGYACKGEYNIPMRIYFNDKNGHDTVHLHVYSPNHPEIELNLCFRDYLRNNPSGRDEYADLKRRLVQDESSSEKGNSVFTNYTLRKGDFIRDILKEAGFNKLRMLKCNDETEWAAAKHVRDGYFLRNYGIEDPDTWSFHHQDHAHLVLYQGIKIIGYAHIEFFPNKSAVIRVIVTHENDNNHNFANEFLLLIAQWLQIWGIKIMPKNQ